LLGIIAKKNSLGNEGKFILTLIVKLAIFKFLSIIIKIIAAA